jgi:hemerythrin-like domain-containing protein
MNSVDPVPENRQMVESVLAILETLAMRLNMGDPLPNAILGDALEFLREFEDAVYEAAQASTESTVYSQRAVQHETARAYLRGMQWALESLERGEAGADGAFVISARSYIRAYRDRARVDDSGFPVHVAPKLATESPPSNPEQTRQDRAMRQRFNRLVKSYRGLPAARVYRPS